MLLTGVEVYFNVCEDEDVRPLVTSGQLSYIDPRWRQRSGYEAALVDLILDMWTRKPRARPDIDHVVARLQAILEEAN